MFHVKHCDYLIVLSSEMWIEKKSMKRRANLCVLASASFSLSLSLRGRRSYIFFICINYFLCSFVPIISMKHNVLPVHFQYFKKLMHHAILWDMSSYGGCHLMWCVASRRLSSYGPHCLMGHVVLRGMLSYGPWRLIGHVVWYGMLSYGACCLMGHVFLRGMLSYGVCHLMGHVV